ncbi:1-phosphofructokinase [Anaerofustis sp.]|uniref:1-phosphofructokinase n=1 Tax=Anaerofustis sp. TaxID=1872517 RepID=UPI0025BDBC53|nr:1-phosphofructokinase [Anaerofustis sp.]
MIYTVTFNPALDYVMVLDKFGLGDVNRTKEEFINPGGKGINVSMMLKELGIANTALGYVAGFTGREFLKKLEERNIKNDFVTLKEGMTRINVKIKADVESEINATGPLITQDDIDLLLNKLEDLENEDILVLAGSVPASMNDNIYEKIMKKVKDKGIKVVVDATKDLLLNVLKYSPFLIKPNHHELAELFSVKIESDSDIVRYANKLREMGAKNVLISMAKDGAILVDERGDVHKSSSPKGKVINSVGAGDSMVAGFICGYERYKDYEKALKLGIAAGSASAFSEGIAQKEKVESLMKLL